MCAWVVWIDLVVDEIFVGEFLECVSGSSWREKCFLVYLLGGEWVVILQNTVHELSAGREIHQSIEPLLFNRLGERGHWQWAYRMEIDMRSW